jgi:predicted aspartyl protease
MGLTHVDATVTGPTGKSQKLELLVDSGASYSLLPAKVWKALKLKPMEKQTFTLADGTHVDRKISECRIALNGIERHSPVILGEPDDEPLFGLGCQESVRVVVPFFSGFVDSLSGWVPSACASAASAVSMSVSNGCWRSDSDRIGFQTARAIRNCSYVRPNCSPA